jgi:hypothetical protein
VRPEESEASPSFDSRDSGVAPVTSPPTC